jgi:nucleoid-associated protein YgaU
MANRYKNIKPKKEADGRRVYRPKIYPNIPKSDQDIFVATQTGDRFDTLANQFYGDSSLWWIIASANNVHDAPIGIEDGTILRIPQNYQKIIKDFES